jgi:heterodisulfide reductase subunit C
MNLRQIVQLYSGQDVRQCRNCALCSRKISHGILDISLEGMVEMIIKNDEEILTSRTVWSDEALTATANACQRGISLPAVILALRTEAHNRGLRGGSQ